ncbi:MAG: NAD-dependent epimerase/dehydratase family protein [Planctomycetes bacterium]|nr:NAD-dependent epimerase/dehydratase family protein [Planctomycetota bacterium]
MTLYVVTGGAGFIGSHLTRALARRGDQVRVVDDLSSGQLENLAELQVGAPGSGSTVELHRADVLDEGLLRAALRGARGVFHEAAQVSVPASIRDPVLSYRINVMGTLGVLEAARAEGVRKVVFAASSAAYGDDPTLPKVETMAPSPLSPYASGKLAGEALLSVWGRAYGLETVALRYFNVYGPGQSDSSPYSGVIALFARAVLGRRAPTIFGDGEQSRDFVFVGDVVQANLLAMERTLERGIVLNVGTGKRVTINELYARLALLAGFPEPPAYAPARIGDVPHSLASIERARERLGFEPQVSLEAGLEQTLAWYRGRS